MRVLVVGSGAREHAIVWKLAQSPKVTKIYSAPGNGGISELAQCVDIHAEDIDSLLTFALKENIDLTVVGPDAAVVDGIVDKFEEKDLKIFGPCKRGAMLEGSKEYAKNFMMKYEIPTARYAVYRKSQEAIEGLKNFTYPLVIKADGLAAGKGVLICANKDEAISAIISIMEDKKFGEAGNKIIIEEFLEGTEASLLCIVDGNKIIPLESARDYKRIFDNDEGLNTGGMGCISPNSALNKHMMKEVEERILNNVIKGIKEENLGYKGILFIGLMITSNGPKVLEFNARFGDPEAEVVIPRLENDIMDIFLKTLDGTIRKEDLKWSTKTCITVFLASAGYPESYEKDKVISGLDEIDKDIIVFHAGTKMKNKLVTNGGRVLAITTLADSIHEGRKKVYENISKIHFDGMQYRKDIGN
ncbi:phosphoribosylamine-glycine ligase [Proteiniborus sp. DW1]|uniref:phosphoribosylamine--glycine ligase n=1 Tax=Proteiniborus sp. DW1 TaxID=1889883 RepID=UPI00092E0D7D|nr:phosphoribosylamine--glycine ligase [Proteiniborus sp. DW1]SCG82053.1 phosphoribosylamine-glycine ligase [Proteiniborus sp. DW1]